MANYIENFNSKLDWTMPFQRTSKFPLDRSCMFSSYDDAVLYASGGADTRGLGGTSYVGQLIVVFENDVVTVYKINADRTIEALTSESGVNADILDLQNQLNAEIAARKAVDGQTGQTYAKNSDATHISAATSLNDADVKLNNAITAETKARQDAINALDATVTSSTTNVGVTVVQTNGKLSSVTLTQTDIASAAALTAEIAARKAVDGQTRQTYAKNTAYTHISAATSLNDADIRLNNAITAETKARQDAINALDATVSGNGTHVDVTVSQLNGKITGVSVAESDIASAAALTAEIAARKAVDGQTGQTYAKNTAATYISAATSLNDADVKLNNAIANLKITSATSAELTSLGTNVKEAYKLIDSNSTQHGSWIKIYKDSSLQEVYLGLSNDTINATTGVITKNTVPSGQTAQSLNFKYQLTDGTYSLVKVDVSKFLAETEYSDGLQVSNSVISVKKDSSSESFLSVSSSGIKLSGVQNAINTAVNNLDATVSGNGTHVDVTVSQLNGKITGVSVAESDIASAAALTNLKNWCAYMSGHTTASAVTSVPTTKRLCIATISSSQTLGLNGNITDGREVHIIIKNNSTSDITVTIPSSIKNLVGENLIIAGSSYGEINLTSDGTNVYYRGIGK